MHLYSSQRQALLVRGLLITLEYFNRQHTQPEDNRHERQLSGAARSWAEEWIRETTGTQTRFRNLPQHNIMTNLYENLFNPEVEPWLRLEPAAGGAGLALPGMLRRTPHLNEDQLEEVLDARAVRQFLPRHLESLKITADGLYYESDIFDLLPEFLICLGGLWAR
jgi:hypothetical protein